MFLINVPLALAAIALTRPGRRISPRGRQNGSSIDWVGIILFAVAIVGLIYGLSRGNRTGWTSSSTLLPIAISAATFVMFAEWSGALTAH